MGNVAIFRTLYPQAPIAHAGWLRGQSDRPALVAPEGRRTPACDSKRRRRSRRSGISAGGREIELLTLVADAKRLDDHAAGACFDGAGDHGAEAKFVGDADDRLARPRPAVE